MNIYCYKIYSKLFNIDVYYDENYIYYIRLPHTSEFSYTKYFDKYFGSYNIIFIYKQEEVINSDILKIKEYLTGKNNQLDSINIKIYGSEFQLKVLSACRKIEYGKVKTYKDLAIEIGKDKAYQAVGGALNKNPIPVIIPCHRVIGSEGSLTGYAGGISNKQKLLNLEQK